jgi:diguanylate cyclase (GGDEF)-like protein
MVSLLWMLSRMKVLHNLILMHNEESILKKADISLEEQFRLETLRTLYLLDTSPEDRFDLITRIAIRLFGVPIALVSLVDESRQWFKSSVGLDVKETPRDISFCSLAILSKEVLVISDALQDERFADNPLVLNEPCIRFYAGCPIKAPNGLNIGTLCLIDRQPRNISDEDIATLKDLAYMVEREIAIVHMATQDELTKLINRRGFMLLAQKNLEFCIRQNTPATLISIDMDQLKSINDRFGHSEGDLALSVFAKKIECAGRDSDICSRIGGDEFSLLLINTTKESAENLIVRLRNSIDKYNQEAVRGYNILFSYSTVEFNTEKHSNIDALLADGDAQLYALKKIIN